MLVEMENCRVLVSDQKVEQMKDIIPVLEQITRQNQPLLIVTEDITGIHSTLLRQTHSTFTSASLTCPTCQKMVDVDVKALELTTISALKPLDQSMAPYAGAQLC